MWDTTIFLGIHPIYIYISILYLYIYIYISIFIYLYLYIYISICIFIFTYAYSKHIYIYIRICFIKPDQSGSLQLSLPWRSLPSLASSWGKGPRQFRSDTWKQCSMGFVFMQELGLKRFGKLVMNLSSIFFYQLRITQKIKRKHKYMDKRWFFVYFLWLSNFKPMACQGLALSYSALHVSPACFKLKPFCPAQAGRTWLGHGEQFCGLPWRVDSWNCAAFFSS